MKQKFSYESLVFFYLTILFCTCACMFYEVTIFYKDEMHRFKEMQKEGFNFGILNQIGNFFKQMVNFFNGLGPRIAALRIASGDFDKGIRTKNQTINVGLVTAMNWFERNIDCPMKKKKCHLYFFIGMIVSAIANGLYSLYSDIMLALGFGDYSDIPFDLYSSLMKEIPLWSFFPVFEEYESCFDGCGAMTSKEIDYNKNVVIPILNHNAETYFERAECEIAVAFAPL